MVHLGWNSSLPCLEKTNIPLKILCRGVESWTVTSVYFCHAHQQDVSRRAENEHKEDHTFLSGQESTVTELGND